MAAERTLPFAPEEVVRASAPLLRVGLGPDARPNRAQAAVAVRAPPQRLWQHLADLEGYPRRVPMIDRISRVNERVTMELRFRIALFSVGFKARLQASLEEGRWLSLRYLEGEPRDLAIHMDLAPVGELTAFYVDVGYEVTSLGWVTTWFLKHHPEIQYGIVPGSALALAQTLRAAAEQQL